MTSTKELAAVVRLLNCPDLNLDELEEETIAAMENIREIFKIPEHFNPVLERE
jgi:hypothetical protein